MGSNKRHSMRFCVSFGVLIILRLLKLSNSQMVPAIFVFGDSLADVGNNNYLPLSISKADFPHNGIDFPNKKPTGRFTNGKNAADLLAQKLGLPTSPPYLSVSSKNAASFMTGVNFASGGSGIFNSSDENLGQAIPLTEQISNYEAVYKAMEGKMGSKHIITKSLFCVITGSNDLFDYSGSSNLRKKYSPQQYTDLMATNLKGLIKILYNYDARKFAFAGVGPIGCIPARRAKNKAEECDEGFNSMAQMYNQRLKALLQELKLELKGFYYSYFDAFYTLENIIQKPSNYGFIEVKAACCGLGKLRAEIPCIPISKYCNNRSDHVFWDPYHPTEAAHTVLVDAIFDGPLDHTFPINVRQLVAI